MKRSILIIQPDSQGADELSLIFSDWGDSVNQASSLKSAGEKLRISLPDILVIDISLLGTNWPQAIPTVKERFQRTHLVFTCASKTHPTPSQFPELVKWQVLTNPFSEDRLKKALDGALSKYDILEPIQKKQQKTYPIRLQISWPYLLLTLFFSLAATFIATRVLFDSAEERFANQLIEAGKLSSEWMVLEEDRLLESLRLVINTISLPDEVLKEEIDSLNRLIYPLAVNSQVEYVEILNPSGVSIYSLRHRSGSTIEDYQTVSGGDYFSETELVLSILERHSDEFGDKFSSTLTPLWGNTFFVAGPIFLNNELVGIAMIGKSLPLTVKELREATLAQTTLYDLEGKVLATTFIAPQEIQSNTIELVLSSQDIASPTLNKDVAEILYTEILAPWEVRNDLDIGILGVALPQNYLVQTNWVTRSQIFIALGVFITLVLILGYRLSNQISKPLESLAKASKEVAAGNFLVTLESPGSKEVAILTTSFNDMLKSLETSQSDLTEAYDNSLQGWSRALSLRDHNTDQHSRRVVETTVALAAELGFDGPELENIRRGSMLHDIGKVGIPDEILGKTGSLTAEEWAIMKKHPLFAIEMLKPVKFLQGALEIPLYHHEKWDGSGYPYGLRGEKIPLSARIFAVVDVYDALLTTRPYRSAWSKQEAIEYLIKNRETHFDPKIVDVFIQVFINEGRI